jgi:hypothetical protein
LSTHNQSARSARADGGHLREPGRGAADTPASAATRSKVLQEDVGRADRRMMSGVSTATPAPLPASSPASSPAERSGGSRSMRIAEPPVRTADMQVRTSKSAGLTPAFLLRGPSKTPGVNAFTLRGRSVGPPKAGGLPAAFKGSRR